MTNLVSLRAIQSDRPLTEDERRDHWRRQAGTLPPDHGPGSAPQLLDADVNAEAEGWCGLVIGPQWPAPTPLHRSPEGSHRIVDLQRLRATA